VLRTRPSCSNPSCADSKSCTMLPTKRQHYHSMVLPASKTAEWQVKDEDSTSGPTRTLIGLWEEKGNLNVRGSPTPVAPANVIVANTTCKQLPKQLLKRSSCMTAESYGKYKTFEETGAQGTAGDAKENGKSGVHSYEVCSIGAFSTADEGTAGVAQETGKSGVHAYEVCSIDGFSTADEGGSPVPSAASTDSLDESANKHTHTSQQLDNTRCDIRLLDHRCNHPSFLTVTCSGHLFSDASPVFSSNGNDEQLERRKQRMLYIQERIRRRDAKLTQRRSRIRSTARQQQTFEWVD